MNATPTKMGLTKSKALAILDEEIAYADKYPEVAKRLLSDFKDYVTTLAVGITTRKYLAMPEETWASTTLASIMVGVFLANEKGLGRDRPYKVFITGFEGQPVILTLESSGILVDNDRKKAQIFINKETIGVFPSGKNAQWVEF